MALSSTNQNLTPPPSDQHKIKQILEDLIETDHLNWSQEVLYSEHQHQQENSSYSNQLNIDQTFILTQSAPSFSVSTFFWR